MSVYQQSAAREEDLGHETPESSGLAQQPLEMGPVPGAWGNQAAQDALRAQAPPAAEDGGAEQTGVLAPGHKAKAPVAGKSMVDFARASPGYSRARYLYGKTKAEIGKEIEQWKDKGQAGATQETEALAELLFDAKGADASGKSIVASAVFEYRSKIDLPTMVNRKAADADTQQRFDQWFAKLKVHEIEHETISLKAKKQLETGIIGKTADDALARVKAIEEAEDLAHKAHDTADPKATFDAG